MSDSTKKKKRRRILEELEELDLMTESNEPSSNFLASSFVPEKKKIEKDPEQIKKEQELDDDNWLSVLTELGSLGEEKVKGSRRKKGYSIFDEPIGKKKKKKKKKGEMVDYAKEFETEAALYRNLLQDQSRFTDSLQKEYDRLKSTKSSARGISKTMTDLIENITQARSLSVQIADKMVGVKKTIADLSLKQRKEFGVGAGEGDNMGEFASTYLKQMINERQNIVGGNSSAEIMDFDDDAVDNILDDTLGELDDDDAATTFLKYETQNVRIWAIINEHDYSDYEFMALDEDGNVIPGYPLPAKSALSVNDSTLLATDAYGRKFPVRWK